MSVGKPRHERRAVAACGECGSEFFADASAMAGLCPECARWLYDYPPCAHDIADGCCLRCGWDGSTSAYVAKLRAQASMS